MYRVVKKNKPIVVDFPNKYSPYMKLVIDLMGFSNTIIARMDEQGIKTDCPNAKSLYLRCLLFPLYPMLGNKNADAVCKVLVSLP